MAQPAIGIQTVPRYAVTIFAQRQGTVLQPELTQEHSTNHALILTTASRDAATV